jgi:hypothetical protein
MTRSVFYKSFWPHLFTKSGWHPQAMRGTEVRFPTGKKKKVVFSANFHKILVKRWEGFR